MAAGHDRGQTVVPTGPPGKDVAHRVDGHGAARLLAPTHEKVTAVTVQIGQRKPAIAALFGGPDLGHFHERVPQSLAVD